jgi:hypothetical protein
MLVTVLATGMSEYVTITVEPDTKEEVQNRLRGGERYDDLLQKMIDAYDQTEG